MGLKNYHKILSRQSDEFLNQFREKYKTDLSRVKNKQKAHEKFLFEFIYLEKRRICDVLQENARFFIDVFDIDEDDISRTYEEILNDEFAKRKHKNKVQLLKDLAYFDALIECGKDWDIWNREYQETDTQNDGDRLNDTGLIRDVEKIEWLGTQKQLGELFLELERKGWIKEKKVSLIENYFTKSNSMSQVLKPSQDTGTKQKLYSGIYTKNYKPVFADIKINISRDE